MEKMKKDKFKSLVNDSVNELGRKYLSDLKKKHSKSRGLKTNIVMQPYLKSDSLSLQEKQLLFKLRTYTFGCKANFRNKFRSNIQCNDCGLEDTQEHLIHCSVAETDNDSSNVKYNDIFGSLQDQCKIVKVVSKICQKRTLIDLKSS